MRCISGNWGFRAFAPHWNGSYVQDSTAVWRKPGPRHVKAPRQGVGNVEDPFAWVDRRGNYHIVAHSQGTVNLCQRNNTAGWNPGSAAGVHFYAADPGGPWTPSDEPVRHPRAGSC